MKLRAIVLYGTALFNEQAAGCILPALTACPIPSVFIFIHSFILFVYFINLILFNFIYFYVYFLSYDSILFCSFICLFLFILFLFFALYLLSASCDFLANTE